jgi:ABC-type iron transport system FetAB ATPase subunit
MKFKRFHDVKVHDVKDGSVPQAEIRLQIPDKSHKVPPKSTLLAQGAKMIWEDTRWWEKLLIFFALALMLMIPLITNWMNVQMVQGATQSFAIIFCVVRILERIVDVMRDCFLLRLGTRLQTLFLESGLAHYVSLSKPSRLSNPAYNFVKFLQEASWAINHLVEWGLFAIGSMVGQSVSAGILLFVFDLEWVDYVVLPIAIAIAVFVIRKLQKLLTERQQISRDIGETTTNLEQMKAINLQNGDIDANEIGKFLLKPILYDNRFVRPLYNYIGCTLDIALELVSLAYAIYLPNDRAFVAKLVLIRTISSALNSVTHFMSQYNTYCNQYLKYRKHFEQTDLSYDEHHEQLPISKQGLQITNVSIQRGENYSIQGGEIPIRLGTHILVQGPSGAGKTSLVDAFRGFIPGVSLSSGVPGNYSHQICMHAQSCESLVQLTSVSLADLFGITSAQDLPTFERIHELKLMGSLADLFGTTLAQDFERIHELLLVVFKESELRRILDNISRENPFLTKIEGKLSGGQQARIFIALTLWNLEKRSSKIVIFDEVESALDPGNRVAILQKLYDYLKARNIAAIWITHMCQCELDKCGIDFDGGRLLLVPREDGSGADIQRSE